MVVIGGGAIGAELAQAFARFGTRISVVEAGPRLLAAEEPEASEVVATRLGGGRRPGAHRGHVRSVAHADGRFGVALSDAEGTPLDLSAERLLVAAGRRPNLSDIGLETVGLDPGARSVDTDARMRAGDRLWAIGDITGKGAFTHMSMYQAAVALADILGRDDARRPSTTRVPRVTFTDPEVGSVGMTEQQARDAGLEVAVGLAPLAESTRGWITGPGGEGLIKLVEDRAAGQLVGATSVGPMGGEVLSMLATAVHARVPTADPGPDAVRLPDLPPRRRDGAGRPAGVAVDAAGRVRAAMAAHPASGSSRAAERRRAALRRAARHRPRPDQQPAPRPCGDARAARRAAGPAGARRRLGVGLDHRPARRNLP